MYSVEVLFKTGTEPITIVQQHTYLGTRLTPTRNFTLTTTATTTTRTSLLHTRNIYPALKSVLVNRIAPFCSGVRSLILKKTEIKTRPIASKSVTFLFQ